jgi:hypothetical protein
MHHSGISCRENAASRLFHRCDASCLRLARTRRLLAMTSKLFDM